MASVMNRQFWLYRWWDVKEFFLVKKYRFGLWAFKWISDEQGDIGFQVFGIITFLKYKESTIIYWFKSFDPAGKWQGFDEDKDHFLGR